MGRAELDPALLRQLRRVGLSADAPPASPEQWQALLAAVSGSYRAQHDDLARMAAAMQAAAAEMRAREDRFTAEAEAARDAASVKTRMLATMSHEVRTPMTGLLGMLDLLRHTDLDDVQRDYLRVAHESAAGLLTVVDDVLDFTRLEAGRVTFERRQFAPAPLARAVAELFRAAAAGNGVALVCRVAADVPDLVVGDPHRVRQVLGNLVGNAVKFTPSGTITLRVACPPDPLVAAEPGRVVLRFEISDTGIGMPEQVVASLFQPFQQADAGTARRYGGTGLGLVISRQLIDAMGGQICVASQPGLGTRFWFDLALPLAAPAPAPEPAPAGGDRLVPRWDGRVLVVEDNVVNQRLAAGMLRLLGLQADLAGDGVEALAMLARQHYDVVLMDCRMPVLDGLAATRQLRRQAGPAASVPVIAMTANVQPAERAACRDAGMDQVLAKPFQVADLVEALRVWLEPPHGVSPRPVAAGVPDMLPSSY